MSLKRFIQILRDFRFIPFLGKSGNCGNSSGSFEPDSVIQLRHTEIEPSKISPFGLSFEMSLTNLLLSDRETLQFDIIVVSYNNR